jgi:hypothetical protein
MPKLLKKWIITHKITQAGTALLYLFVTFIAPLNHTCNLCEKSLKCHCDNQKHCFLAGPHTDSQLKVAFKQNIHKAETRYHSGICMACLYSIISKFTQINTAKISINTIIPSFFRIPITFKIVKQLKWRPSVLSRAPPIINS